MQRNAILLALADAAPEDVLLVLDDAQTRAEFDVLSDQYVVLRATEVRLLAELANEPELAMPPELAARQGDSLLSGKTYFRCHGSPR